MVLADSSYDWLWVTEIINEMSKTCSIFRHTCPHMGSELRVLFRLHREMHRALSLLPRKTQQLRETGETGEI